MALVRMREACVLCGHAFGPEPVLTLPGTPPANEFVAEPREQETFPLAVYLCPDCGHLQLQAVVDPVRLFGGYVYTSGTSPAAIAHWSGYAQTLASRFALGAGSVVVDVGSNDGTLLREFRRRGARVHGVEPAGNIAAQARRAGIPTTSAFFDHEVASDLRKTAGPADVITANNVFAHMDDLESAALAARSLLAPGGVFVLEVSYLLDVVERVLFDTIYHEHLSYHAIRPLRRFFARLGMTLFDAERVPAQGGSLRCYVAADGRPVSPAVGDLEDLETAAGLFSPATYREFGKAIDARRKALAGRLERVRAGGGRLCGYGAPAKLTTLMYALDLDGGDFDFVVDDSPLKQGLFTPGKHVPVTGPDAFGEASGRGYTCVVFAWNFHKHITGANWNWDGAWINPGAP